MPHDIFIQYTKFILDKITITSFIKFTIFFMRSESRVTDIGIDYIGNIWN